MNQSHSLRHCGYWSVLSINVLMMKVGLCLPQLDLCELKTSSRVKTSLNKLQEYFLISKNETKTSCPSQIEFLYLRVFKVCVLYHGSRRT